MVLELPSKHASILPGHGWRPPEGELIKINTDAGISMQEHRGGVGGVARSSSVFLAAWCKPCPGITDPLVAEATAVREGVIVATLRGFARVEIETDSLEVVNLWKSRRISRSVIAPLLLDIEELAATLVSFDVVHVRRHANVPAHLSAQQACTKEATECWMGSPPGFLVTSLMADMAGASSYE